MLVPPPCWCIAVPDTGKKINCGQAGSIVQVPASTLEPRTAAPHCRYTQRDYGLWEIPEGARISLIPVFKAPHIK